MITRNGALEMKVPFNKPLVTPTGKNDTAKHSTVQHRTSALGTRPSANDGAHYRLTCRLLHLTWGQVWYARDYVEAQHTKYRQAGMLPRREVLLAREALPSTRAAMCFHDQQRSGCPPPVVQIGPSCSTLMERGGGELGQRKSAHRLAQ